MPDKKKRSNTQRAWNRNKCLKLNKPTRPNSNRVSASARQTQVVPQDMLPQNARTREVAARTGVKTAPATSQSESSVDQLFVTQKSLQINLPSPFSPPGATDRRPWISDTSQTGDSAASIDPFLEVVQRATYKITYAYGLTFFNRDWACLRHTHATFSEREETPRLWAADAWLKNRETGSVSLFTRFMSARPLDAYTKLILVPSSSTWTPSQGEFNTNGCYEQLPANCPLRIFFVLAMPFGSKIEWDAANLFTKLLHDLVGVWLRRKIGAAYDTLRHGSDGRADLVYQVIESCSEDQLSYRVVISHVQVSDILQAKFAAMDFACFLLCELSTHRPGDDRFAPLLACARERCATGTFVDLSVYTESSQLCVLGAKQIEVGSHQVKYVGMHRLVASNGFLIGESFDRRPPNFIPHTSCDLYDVWKSCLCRPITQSAISVFFEPKRFTQYRTAAKGVAEKKFLGRNFTSAPHGYIQAAVNLLSKSPRWALSEMVPEVKKVNSKNPLDFTEKTLTPTSWAQSSAESEPQLPSSFRRSSRFSIIDGDHLIATKRGSVVPARQLVPGIELYCPHCQTVYATDEFHVKQITGRIGISDARAYSTHDGHIIIKCFQGAECNVTTLVSDLICHLPEYQDDEFNVDNIVTLDSLKSKFSLSSDRVDSAVKASLVRGELGHKLICLSGPIGIGNGLALLGTLQSCAKARTLIITKRRQLRVNTEDFGRRRVEHERCDEHHRVTSSPVYKTVDVSNLRYALQSNSHYQAVIIEDLCDIMDRVGRSHMDPEQTMPVLKSVLRAADTVIVMHHDMSPTALAWIQTVTDAGRTQTWMCRATACISKIPTVAIELSSSCFAKEAGKLHSGLAQTLYKNVVLRNKRKLYIPCSTEQQALTVALSLGVYLKQLRSEGLVDEGDYESKLSRIRVANAVGGQRLISQKSLGWIDRFNELPEECASEVDVLIATSEIQAGVSLPPDFTHMIGVISRLPLTMHQISLQLSRIRANVDPNCVQGCILIVEKGDLQGETTPSYDPLSRGGLSDGVSSLVSCTALHSLREREELSRSLHWKIRSLYGQNITIFSEYETKGLSVDDLSRLFNLILPNIPSAAEGNVDAELFSKIEDDASQLAINPVHTLHMHFPDIIGGLSGKSLLNVKSSRSFLRNETFMPVSGPTPFHTLRSTNRPPTPWISEAWTVMQPINRRCDISPLTMVQPFGCFDHIVRQGTPSYLETLHDDFLVLATLSILFHRKAHNYEQWNDRAARLNATSCAREDLKTLPTVPGIASRIGVWETAELFADVLTELGFVDFNCSDAVKLVLDSWWGKPACPPRVQDRLSRHFATFLRNEGSAHRYKFFRWYLSEGSPLRSNAECLRSVELAVAMMTNGKSLHLWWFGTLKIPSENSKNHKLRKFKANPSSSIVTSGDICDWTKSVEDVFHRLGLPLRTIKDLNDGEDRYVFSSSGVVMRLGLLLGRNTYCAGLLHRYLGSEMVDAMAGAAILFPIASAVSVGKESWSLQTSILKHKRWKSTVDPKWLLHCYTVHSSRLSSWLDSSVAQSVCAELRRVKESKTSPDQFIVALSDAIGFCETYSDDFARIRVFERGNFPTLGELSARLSRRPYALTF